MVAQWVGLHWQGARPAVVFLCLRWAVAIMAGLALASLIQWWGGLLSGAVKNSPVGWLDRLGGFAVGAALGVVVSSFVLLAALLTTWPSGISETAARARLAAPLMAGGARLCGLEQRYFPGSDWLKERFLAARQRATSQLPQS